MNWLASAACAKTMNNNRFSFERRLFLLFLSHMKLKLILALTSLFFFFFNRGLLILKSSICCCLGPVCQFGGSTTDFFLGCFCAVRPQPMRNSLCHTDLLWLLFLLFSLPRMERKIPKMELSSSQHHHLHHHNRRASWLWCQFSAPVP